MLRHTILLIALLGVGGCDSFYGVETATTLEPPIDIECVEAALASVKQAVAIRRQHEPNNYAWLYGSDQTYILQIVKDVGPWHYWNGLRQMNRPVSDDDIDRFVPLMRLVNSAIGSRCGLLVGRLEPRRL